MNLEFKMACAGLVLASFMLLVGMARQTQSGLYWGLMIGTAIAAVGFLALAHAKELPETPFVPEYRPPVKQRPLSQRIKMAQVGESLTVSAALENIDPLRAAHLKEQQEARNGNG
jgi:hypothetical protein